MAVFSILFDVGESDPHSSWYAFRLVLLQPPKNLDRVNPLGKMWSAHRLTNSTPLSGIITRSPFLDLSVDLAQKRTSPSALSISRELAIGPPVIYRAKYFKTCSALLVFDGGPSMNTTQSMTFSASRAVDSMYAEPLQRLVASPNHLESNRSVISKRLERAACTAPFDCQEPAPRVARVT